MATATVASFIGRSPLSCHEFTFDGIGALEGALDGLVLVDVGVGREPSAEERGYPLEPCADLVLKVLVAALVLLVEGRDRVVAGGGSRMLLAHHGAVDALPGGVLGLDRPRVGHAGRRAVD